jgi:hypothetical protein
MALLAESRWQPRRQLQRQQQGQGQGQRRRQGPRQGPRQVPGAVAAWTPPGRSWVIGVAGEAAECCPCGCPLLLSLPTVPAAGNCWRGRHRYRNRHRVRMIPHRISSAWFIGHRNGDGHGDVHRRADWHALGDGRGRVGIPNSEFSGGEGWLAFPIPNS